MKNISRDVKKEINKLEEMKEKVEAFLAKAPKGCLKWQHRRDKTYYYHQYKKEDNILKNDTADKSGSGITLQKRTYR